MVWLTDVCGSVQDHRFAFSECVCITASLKVSLARHDLEVSCTVDAHVCGGKAAG